MVGKISEHSTLIVFVLSYVFSYRVLVFIRFSKDLLNMLRTIKRTRETTEGWGGGNVDCGSLGTEQGHLTILSVRLVHK